MTTTGRYAITFLGNGLVRLPRAGIFQTGTRAVVDETVARIAVAHGSFAVSALGPDTAGLATPGPVETPVAAAPAAPAAPTGRKTRGHRASAAIAAVDPNSGTGR